VAEIPLPSCRYNSVGEQRYGVKNLFHVVTKGLLFQARYGDPGRALALCVVRVAGLGFLGFQMILGGRCGAAAKRFRVSLGFRV
jgi:hypothetical protein